MLAKVVGSKVIPLVRLILQAGCTVQFMVTESFQMVECVSDPCHSLENFRW